MSKDSKIYLNILIKTLKIIWVPVLVIVAFLLGLYIGFDFIVEESSSDIFTQGIWSIFFDQIRALR